MENIKMIDNFTKEVCLSKFIINLKIIKIYLYARIEKWKNLKLWNNNVTKKKNSGINTEAKNNDLFSKIVHIYVCSSKLSDVMVCMLIKNLFVLNCNRIYRY